MEVRGMNYSVPLKRLVEEFNLSIAYESTDYERIEVKVDEVGTERPDRPVREIRGAAA